ncbi:thymidylate kinase [Elgaria multicarinata webbii]|uniref:thymidylate kinase n=1 Tax=Elgaria multicarinata webbii TaxID=159646 RepID=UPI002FCD4137
MILPARHTFRNLVLVGPKVSRLSSRSSSGFGTMVTAGPLYPLGGLFYDRGLRGKQLLEVLLPSFLRATKRARMAGRRGTLIVLEGVDRAGKSTQSRKLVEALRAEGHQAELLRFPERTTEIGRLISSYLEKKKNLEDHTVHLLFSANRWEQVPLIKEKLNQGVTLVVDRYAFSGVAFTSAKEKFSLEWCKQPDVGLPKPDLILFLQLSTSEAAKRGDFGNERYENSPFQEKVLQCFYHLMKDKTLNWKMIDASKNIEDLHNEIKSFAEEAMQEAEHTPIGELWK